MSDAETFPAVLALRRADAASVPAVVADDATLTYAELDAASAVAARRLVAAGVVKGDHVGLLAANSARWAVLAHAVLRSGAVLVPLSTLLRPPELVAQVRTAGVSHLLVDEEVRGRRHLEELDAAEAPGLLAALAGGGRHPAVPSLRGVWPTDALPPAEAPPPLLEAMEARVRPADDAVVLFTSGSTGAPKGTIHTHGGAVRATAAGLDARCVRAGERIYLPMPFFWTGGFSSGLVTAAVAGATVVTEAEPEPERTLRLLERERVTLFRGWPDQAARLAAHPTYAEVDLSALGDASLTALLPPDRRPPPGARPNLLGMTETFGPYCSDPLDVDMPPERWGSCGRPLPGVEVRITDPERGEAVAAGEEGEIWLRGPNLLRGVCGRPRTDTFTVDGWFRTGDRGVLDEAGYLWYRGRRDDMVKVRGATVYPSEVEAALRALDAVRQAHVTDVEGPAGAPEVAALVVSDAPVDELRAAVRERLSAFKVPTRWRVVADPDAVPMTATGKVDKRALRALLTEEDR